MESQDTFLIEARAVQPEGEPGNRPLSEVPAVTTSPQPAPARPKRDPILGASVREEEGLVGRRMKRGWLLLHSELPEKALSPISKDVYGVEGLSDVNEGYLITRLFASELGWSWEIASHDYLGSEVRRTRGDNGHNYTVYLAAVHGVLTIGGQKFHGSGAHDNRKIDAAFKGAATVAFKNAAKMAGLFNQLLMDGRAMDFIYSTRDPQTSNP